MQSTLSDLTVSYTARGLSRYSITVRHAGLQMIQEIRGDDKHLVLQKAYARAAQWDERWAKRAANLKRVNDRTAKAHDRESKKEEADQRTTEATEAWAALDTILSDTLAIDDAVDWTQLFDRRRFPTPQPRPPARLPEPPSEPHPPRPQLTDRVYQYNPTFIEKSLALIVPSRKKKRMDALQSRFNEAEAIWKQTCAAIDLRNATRRAEVERTNERAAESHRLTLKSWEAERDAFLSEQAARNAAVEAQRGRYERQEPQAIIDYCDLVLSNSKYPDWMPREWAIDFVPDSRLLIVDFRLPSVADLPRLKAVKYVAARDSFESADFSDAQVAKAYDAVLYQIALRTLHELFEADRIQAIDTIAWNGRVTSIDPGTGHSVEACLMSLSVRREEFVGINLGAVDPKACFRKLRGVGSSKLHSLTPVAPLVTMKTDDVRFTQSYAVASALDEGENLASMDWEDFEHLVREVFEKEFATEGAEVRVTRASRDGGIDAVVFDPHPIRGGKIVIQAKRYTATVGVSAVRDLYGTAMNEGANKGILVTTAAFGPDAYAFAKDKPLTLIDGGTLLHLLQKHGHKVRIDLVEARQQRSG